MTDSRSDPLPHVVIVGAGFGGLAVARGLRNRAVRVTIVDRQNHHLFQPLLYQVATAGLSPSDIAAPIRTIVKDYQRTSVLLDQVTGVDSAAKTVAVASGTTLAYDHLVLATGARHSYFGRDDWADLAPGIKTIDDATRVRGKILIALERAETERQEHPALRDRPIRFVIIGGGPTGVEMAGAIAELTRHAAEMDFRYVSRDCVQIMLVEAGERLLAAFPERLGKHALESLRTLGVDVRLGYRVSDITATCVMIGEERVDAAAVVWAAGVQASPAARWLGVEGDRAGRVPVAADLSVAGHADVFVIGDTAACVDKKGRAVPGIAPAAKQQGKFVARLITARVKGRTGPRRFRYRNYGNLATIGRKRAVADFGWMQLHGLPAWLIWSTAHIFFLVGFRSRLIVGTNWLWNYVTFERGARLITGLDVSDQRSSLS